MKQQMVSFTDPQFAFLAREKRRLGISLSDLVRRIIDEYRQRHEPPTSNDEYRRQLTIGTRNADAHEG